MHPVRDYFRLRRNIDMEADRLTNLHSAGMTCRSGCDGCCVNLAVFPVEFFSILQDMKRAGLSPGSITFAEDAPCGFLNDNLCRIYRFRPIICRTHGLPILFIDESSGEPRWEVSFCERNFTGGGLVEFPEDTLLDIENINAELNRINLDFLALLPKTQRGAQARIPLKYLVTRLSASSCLEGALP